MTNKKLSKTVASLSLIFALTFSTNSQAWGWGNWWANWWNNWTSGGGNHGSNHCSKCGGNHSGGCQTGGGSHDSVPVDGGLGILLLGAAAFGARKLRGNKNAEI